MLIELANHNADIKRLLDKGYALRVDGAHLVVRDIPYLDANKQLQVGAIVSVLVFTDKVHVIQQNHEIYFAGGTPYNTDGTPVRNLGGGEVKVPLQKTDVTIERSFSNKPENGFPDFFAKIEHYVNLIAGPAMSLFDVTPLTWRIDTDEIKDSVFKFQDSLSARAEIGDLASVLKEEVIAIIGLGGTGAYVLDYLVKSPVKEIRGFDADVFHVHNAFRAPGRLDESELNKPKADVYQGRYENFREGLILKRTFIDSGSASEFAGVTFAFVCVDKGTSRSEIFDLLIGLKIPFIDVGLGLDRKRHTLSGTLRATHYSVADAERTREMGLAEMADHPDDAYRKNVQIAELNAMNACIAVLRYKQLRGFYTNDNDTYHLLFNIGNLKLFSQ